MGNPGAILVVIVGMLILASVVYNRTCCFGGFYNCMVNGCDSTKANPGTTAAPAAKSVGLSALPSLAQLT
jgi:hypothetical protein